MLPLPVRLLLIFMLSLMAAGLIYAVWTLPEFSPGLSAYTTANIAISGVINPVTAVLLNYRAYDTFLELAVLLIVLIGVWSLGGVSYPDRKVSSTVLDAVSRLLVPLLILVAGYLLWVGAYAPGGAFQAGSVLGAAGVLLILAGWRLSPKLAGMPLRISLVAGMVLFAVIGIVLALLGGQLLELTPTYASVLIVLIESDATISIGVALIALFLGGDPQVIINEKVDK